MGSVDRIAEIVAREMGLESVMFQHTGGLPWKGDLPYVFLDTSKVMKLGFRPRYNSEEAVVLATEALLKEGN